MDIVDVEIWLDRAQHPPQRTAAVLIGKFMPVMGNVAAATTFVERCGDAAVPIEDRAAGIEGEDLASERYRRVMAE
jgi:hypothetical protein